jgi:DNA-binding NarL/FixJ family response regulator
MVEPMDLIRVVIAEDNVFLREGIRTLLAAATDIELVALCGDLDEARTAVSDLIPDVVLTDIRMPPSHADEGIRLANEIRSNHPLMGVIAFSQHLEPSYAIAMFGDGSSRRGYLLKDRVDDVEVLANAIRAVASGGSFIDDDVVASLIRRHTRAVDNPLTLLSPREREILGAVATGRSNASVAAHLGITDHAVEKHIGSIFIKLGIATDSDTHRRVTAVVMYLADPQ